MVEALDPEELLLAIRTVLNIESTDTHFKVLSTGIRDGLVLVEFHWAEDQPTYGVRIEVPDTTEHPSWVQWCPQTVEEWATYAVKWRMIEELETGLLGRAPRSFDGRVTWLELPPQ